MVAVEARGPSRTRRRPRPARRRRRAGCRAGSGTRPSCPPGCSSPSRIFRASSTCPARRRAPARCSSDDLRLVARLGGRGERLGRLAPALEVLEGDAAMEVGEAEVARLAQVVQARLEAAEQDLAHAEPQVDVGRHRPLLAVAHRGHGVAERPIARRVAAQHLAEVGHGRDVERITVQERAHIGGHQLGHPSSSPSALASPLAIPAAPSGRPRAWAEGTSSPLPTAAANRSQTNKCSEWRGLCNSDVRSPMPTDHRVRIHARGLASTRPSIASSVTRASDRTFPLLPGPPVDGPSASSYNEDYPRMTSPKRPLLPPVTLPSTHRYPGSLRHDA